MRTYQDFRKYNNRGGYRGNYRNENYNGVRGRIGLEKDHIQTIIAGETEVVVIVDQGRD